MHGVRWSPLASSRSEAVVQLHHLHEWNVEAALQLEQDAERRVDLAVLDRADVVAVEIGTVAELLLREALLTAKSADGETERKVLGRLLSSARPA